MLWPRVTKPYLRIVLYHTRLYQLCESMQASKLNISWTPTNADTSHSSLTPNGARDYASNASACNVRIGRMTASTIFDRELPLPDQGTSTKRKDVPRLRPALYPCPRPATAAAERPKLLVLEQETPLRQARLVRSREQYPLVIFHGDVGTGKTATAECIANRLVAE